jgi:hypothetical protein
VITQENFTETSQRKVRLNFGKASPKQLRNIAAATLGQPLPLDQDNTSDGAILLQDLKETRKALAHHKKELEEWECRRLDAEKRIEEIQSNRKHRQLFGIGSLNAAARKEMDDLQKFMEKQEEKRKILEDQTAMLDQKARQQQAWLDGLAAREKEREMAEMQARRAALPRGPSP